MSDYKCQVSEIPFRFNDDAISFYGLENDNGIFTRLMPISFSFPTYYDDYNVFHVYNKNGDDNKVLKSLLEGYKWWYNIDVSNDFNVILDDFNDNLISRGIEVPSVKTGKMTSIQSIHVHKSVYEYFTVRSLSNHTVEQIVDEFYKFTKDFDIPLLSANKRTKDSNREWMKFHGKFPHFCFKHGLSFQDDDIYLYNHLSYMFNNIEQLFRDKMFFSNVDRYGITIRKGFLVSDNASFKELLDFSYFRSALMKQVYRMD